MTQLDTLDWSIVNGILIEHVYTTDHQFYSIYQLTSPTGDVLYGTTRCCTLQGFSLAWPKMASEMLTDWQYFTSLAAARHAMGNVSNEDRGIQPFKYNPTLYIMEPERHYCLCCGYKTIEGYKTNFGYTKPPRTYAICPICFWQDDAVAYTHPDEVIGPNRVSLRQAQRNFIEFGATERRVLPYVHQPNTNDVRDPGWRLM